MRDKALQLSAELLELVAIAPPGGGQEAAAQALDQGQAWATFQRICEEQGGMRLPPRAGHSRPMPAGKAGTVIAMDNRKLARIAKLAGAPDDKAAGIEIHVRVGDRAARGEPLYTVHSENRGGLEYALEYAAQAEDVMSIGDGE